MRFAATVAFLLLASSAAADDPDVAKGRKLAELNCNTCHAIDRVGESPLMEAPPFRDIAARYEQEELEDALNEGVPTEHPVMPDWQLTPEQARNLSLFIMSLLPAG